MTLKMGIERKMREAIPEVSEVVQVLWPLRLRIIKRIAHPCEGQRR